MTTERKFKCLTVGDGDFSFSAALLRSGHCSGELLFATSYDSVDSVVRKYGEAAKENLNVLLEAGALVQHGVDATNLHDHVSKGVVVDEIHFMHPLIDAEDKDRLARSGSIACNSDYIIQNRLLVLSFLQSAQSYLLRPSGEIKVTIKDVYPYSWWRVNHLVHYAPPLCLKRVESFAAESYPGYVSRTVDRDGTLPVDSASTFVFGTRDKDEDAASDLVKDITGLDGADFVCTTCDKTFTSDGDRMRHLGNRKHNARAHLEQRWSAVVANFPP